MFSMSTLPMLLVVLVLTCVHHAVVCQPVVQSLAGNTWAVHNGNGTVVTSASVPGNIYLDLLNSSVIADPLHGYNELSTRSWVAYHDWTYTRTFDVEDAVLQSNVAELRFDGIDTISDVYLNNVQLGSTDNMHRQYTYNVKSTLRPADNNLTVVLHSAVRHAQHLHDTYPYDLPVMDPALNLPYRNMVRKGQSDFGWDWGLGLAGCGIWRDVYLYAYETVSIDRVVVQQIHGGHARQASTNIVATHADGDVQLYFDVYMSTGGNAMTAGTLTVEVVDTDCYVEQHVDASASAVSSYTAQINCTVRSPLLWWTHMLGTPHLYTVNTKFRPSRARSVAHSQQIGFRHVELVQDQLSETDATFYIRLNGVAVWAKGANVIPLNVYHTIDHDAIDSTIQAALFANMNMLRVWGGGVYADDLYYELCDKHGLMVWQEFMFACSLNPVNEEYLQTVSVEVEQQVKRIASHPSVVVYGGNNENEAALLGWFDLPADDIHRYRADYMSLYIDTVYAMLRSVLHADQYIWLDSSPTKGLISTQPYVKRWDDVTQVNRGDIHWYNSSIDCNDVEHFAVGKFVSEFGWQSMPSYHAWSTVVEQPDDLKIYSSFQLYRQRHPDGIEQLQQQLAYHFHLPSKHDSASTFKDWVYLTQIVQAKCYTNAIQLWRARKHDGVHSCMGALYWQLNDVWTAPTWSSVERDGRYKLLHYAVRDVYAPVILAAWLQRSDQTVRISVVSDVAEAFKANITISVYAYTNSVLISQVVMDAYVDVFGVAKLMPAEVSKLLSPTAHNPDQCVIEVSASADINIDIKSIFVPLTPLHEVDLPAVALDWTAEQAGEEVIVTLKANDTAVHVFAQTAVDGQWSDNGMTILSNQIYTVKFTPTDSHWDWSDFLRTLEVKSVWDALPTTE